MYITKHTRIEKLDIVDSTTSGGSLPPSFWSKKRRQNLSICTSCSIIIGSIIKSGLTYIRSEYGDTVWRSQEVLDKKEVRIIFLKSNMVVDVDLLRKRSEGTTIHTGTIIQEWSSSLNLTSHSEVRKFSFSTPN